MYCLSQPLIYDSNSLFICFVLLNLNNHKSGKYLSTLPRVTKTFTVSTIICSRKFSKFKCTFNYSFLWNSSLNVHITHSFLPKPTQIGALLTLYSIDRRIQSNILWQHTHHPSPRSPTWTPHCRGWGGWCSISHKLFCCLCKDNRPNPWFLLEYSGYTAHWSNVSNTLTAITL
jgi:hypothetical protein